MPIPDVFKVACRHYGWSCEGNAVLVATGDARQQRVSVEVFSEGDEAFARIFTAIGDVERLSDLQVRSALSLNARLPHGALAIRDEQLVMTDTLRLRGADPDEVSRSLVFLAETADRYEKALFSTDRH